MIVSDDANSVENVRKFWLPEARHNAPSKPIILVGTKGDTRSEEDTQPFLISKTEAEKLRKDCGACLYVECSAKNRINVDYVFISAVKIMTGEIPLEKPKKKRRCVFL